MRASLAATVEIRGDATVVHLAGSLGVSTASVLRTTVLECLATEPAVIVLDVSELRAHDDVALTVLPALAQHAAAWPGSAVSMAAAPAPLRSALDRMAVARQIPLFATTDAAIAHGCTGAPGEPRGMRANLQPMLDATAAARHLVGRACRLWGVARVADLAELIITELVSNGVRHARTNLEVRVALRHRQLHLSVRDGSRQLPVRGSSGDTLAESGRGLLVVEALTDRWGCTPVPDGKVVWATLRTR
ncbi:ATP-binding protein [Dactylosporangium aurantiacum]|uniref:ATP-binding protein n=1 Tax=Dactylosporangium aurantiacum TaxID=35754 RepID=A0A9Q9MEU2_9ACTN|nr:ATP-binding protein [Dactylosporangium aurantiacum]MDG6108044.1 ATP-binding protein [Dactylosporangium aurantiacum]UWZ53679.1 ATP-binding protein [Dactylosporangium aurantiacum]